MARFTWDEAKRQSNLRKHGLDFADAPGVLAGNTYTEEDNRFLYPERRYNTTGFCAGRLVTVTYTENYHEVRIISMRRASRRETDAYHIHGI
ncbi:BrnT family toxin [Oxalobacteraceae bacterium A2-2]